MAKIKTLRYTVDDQEVKIDISCSSKGVFSFSISQYWKQLLNIKSKNYESLAEIETELNISVNEYINSKTKLKLKIGITFGASGDFLKGIKGDILPAFQDNKNHKINSYGVEFKSMIGLDYRVVIEEHRNGIVNYYQAVSLDKFQQSQIYPWNRVINGYVDDKLIYRLNESERLIDFSEQTLESLSAIKQQLQKASAFLGELFTSEELELILTSEIKLLENSK